MTDDVRLAREKLKAHNQRMREHFHAAASIPWPENEPALGSYAEDDPELHAKQAVSEGRKVTRRAGDNKKKVPAGR